MTLADINNKINSLTNDYTGQYAAADRLIDINLWQQKIVGMIMDSEDETYFDDARFTGYPKVTIPMTTNRDYYISPSQTDTGGITYSVLKVKTVSVSYDGTNYYTATPGDLDEMGLPQSPASATTQTGTTDAYFARTAPMYSYKNSALFIYPAAQPGDVTNGATIIVELERGAAEFTLSDLNTGTAIPGFDITFHAMLAYGPAWEWLNSKEMPQATTVYRELQVYENRLQKQYSLKQLDRRLQMQPLVQWNK